MMAGTRGGSISSLAGGGGLGRLGGLDTDPLGHAHQVRHRLDLHLVHDPATVNLNGLLGGPEVEGDLFSTPATTSPSTSRSRRGSVSKRRWMMSRSARSARAWRPRASARSTALNSSFSSNGFWRKSIAPPFMACTLIGTLPNPAMKMVGMARLASRSAV